MRLAGSHTSTNSYDGLNRLTGATYADSTTATLTYDTGTYGIGHLTELQDVAGTTNWTYDQHGRPTQMQQTTTGSISLTVSYSYDAYGRPDTITYPSGRAITRSYDADGRVTKLAESTATVKGELGASVPDRVLCVSARSQALRKLRACLRPAGNAPSRAIPLAAARAALRADKWPPARYGRGQGRLADGIRLRPCKGRGYGGQAPTWSYDDRGRMASATVGGVTTHYGINGLGQRISKWASGVPNGGLNEYVYDLAGHLIGEYDSSGAIIEETVYLGDLPVAVLTGIGGGAHSDLSLRRKANQHGVRNRIEETSAICFYLQVRWPKGRLSDFAWLEEACAPFGRSRCASQSAALARS